MTNSEELSSIIDRIAGGKHTETDIAVLRQVLSADDNRQATTQLGKYNVNIGQGQGIQIGDRTYLELNDEAIQALIRAIQKPSTVLSQFQSLIQDKTEGFVGREYVFDAIQTFIQENKKGYFTIIGDPGQGKSAILAKYVQDTECIAHFNVQLQGPNRADQFLESVCNQLIARYQMPYNSLPSNTTLDGEFLGHLLDEVAQRRNGQPVIIAVDALDEVDKASYRRDANILYLPPHLPDGVYFIMTRRRGVEVLLTIYAPNQIISLLDYQIDSQRDVRLYIQNRVDDSGNLRQQIDERQETIIIFTDKIADKSENNFMYLRYVLLDIEKGLYKDLSLESFPQGLQGYYDFHWRRMGMTANPLPIEKIKIVYILGEVREPVSRRKICDFSGEDEYSVQQVLNEWKQFLHELMKQEKRYSIYHASFRDFLHQKDILETHPVTLPGIHQLIAENEKKVWQKLKGVLRRSRGQ
jgi:serine/threonine-protein kinase